MNAGILDLGYAPPVMPRPLLGQPQPVPTPYGRSGDPYWDNVSLLLRMDGPHGSRTFTDLSKNRFTVTANGDAQISGQRGRFAATSGLFDGNGDFLAVPSNTVFSFGTGDFTIEALVFRTTASGARAIVDCRSSDALVAWSVYLLTGNTLDFLYQSSAPQRITSTTTVPLNQWSHVAVSRSGSTIRLFIDGVVDGTATFSGNINATNSAGIGGGRSTAGSGVTGYFYTGNISELRITRGVARYTSNFPAPTAPFQIGYQ